MKDFTKSVRAYNSKKRESELENEIRIAKLDVTGWKKYQQENPTVDAKASVKKAEDHLKKLKDELNKIRKLK